MVPKRTISIDVSVVTEYRRLRYNWVDIAKVLNVNIRTLRRWVRATDFVEPLQRVTNEVLDHMISCYSNSNPPHLDEASTCGFLASTNVRCTRQELRDSLRRTDPDGILARSTRRIARRQYRVEGPYHLVHIDGHHKLIRYGMVTHGCIDGFSRVIMYLVTSNNNRATTQLNNFLQAMLIHGVPSRVRGDHGGENSLIAQWMIDHVGPNRHSFITGSSKHNTRIERLWRDYRDKVSSFYMSLFRHLEHEYGMDIENKRHMYTLQYMFLPRINEHNGSFINSYNNHPLRTENNRSPNRILMDAENNIPPPIEFDVAEYAELLNLNENPDIDDIPMVQLDPIDCPLNDENLLLFKLNNKPLSMNDNGFDSILDRYTIALANITLLCTLQG